MFCRYCGKDIPDDSKFCRGCGKLLLIDLPPQKKWPSRRRIVITTLVALAALIVIVLISISSSAPSSSTQPSATDAVAPTGNISNDKIRALASDEQAKFLGLAVDDGCVGTRAFYQGIYSADNSAFWSVACVNGRSYSVQIFADADGHTKVLDCSLLRAFAHVNCFQKFSGQ